MRKNLFKVLSLVLTIICILLSLIVIYKKIYRYNNEGKSIDLNTKIISEIDYLDGTVIEAMNKLNNISIVRYKVYTKSINKPNSGEKNNEEDRSGEDEQKENKDSKNENESLRGNDVNKIKVSKTIANNPLTENKEENINWDEITYIYENIYSVWPTIEMDLKKLGMKDEYVNKFNLDLNGVAQSINGRDKKSALVNYYNLYSQLPNYLQAVTDDKYLLNMYKCKAEVLNSYVLADEENKWKEMSESTAKSKEILKTMLEESDEEAIKKSSIEKTYAIVNDLESSTILNDRNIFYMQYKNAIQALETM